MLIAIMAVEALQFVLVAVSITGTTPIDETDQERAYGGGRCGVAKLLVVCRLLCRG